MSTTPEALRIVERLRTGVYGLNRIALCQKAADAIERLTAERDALKLTVERLQQHNTTTWNAGHTLGVMAGQKALSQAQDALKRDAWGNTQLTEALLAAEAERDALRDALQSLCNRIEYESATPLDWNQYDTALKALAAAPAPDKPHATEAEGEAYTQGYFDGVRDTEAKLTAAPAPHPDTADAERWRHVLRRVYFVRRGEYVMHPGRPNAGRDDSIGGQWLRRDVDAAIDAARAHGIGASTGSKP